MTTPPDPAAPPRLLAGRYELIDRISTGSIATVWKAWDTVLTRYVAVKILRPSVNRDDDARARFKQEAIAAARLVHPGIVAIFDTGSDQGEDFLVMEWVEGRRLDDAIKARGSDYLDIDEVAHISRRIALALAYAHDQGMIHGGLCSHNVFLAADGQVKVADFGLARAVGAYRMPAPEQVRGQTIDPRTDLWALGLILHELLTGTHPIQGRSKPSARLSADLPRPSLRRGDIPTDLDDLVALLTASNPDNRPDSAGRVAQALAHFERSQPVTPIKHKRAGRPWWRELLWTVPVICLLASAGYLMYSAKIGFTTTTKPGTAQASPTGPSSDHVAVIVGATAFDPDGDKRERDDLLDGLYDDAPATSWRTEPYHTADFGGLKDGVGVVLDLGSAKRISEVTVVTPEGGFDVHIGLSSTPQQRYDGFTIAAKSVQVKDNATLIPIDPPEMGRYVLVWLTGNLPKTSDRYRAELSSVTIRHRP